MNKTERIKVIVDLFKHHYLKAQKEAPSIQFECMGNVENSFRVFKKRNSETNPTAFIPLILSVEKEELIFHWLFGYTEAPKAFNLETPNAEIEEIFEEYFNTLKSKHVRPF